MGEKNGWIIQTICKMNHISPGLETSIWASCPFWTFFFADSRPKNIQFVSGASVNIGWCVQLRAWPRPWWAGGWMKNWAVSVSVGVLLSQIKYLRLFISCSLPYRTYVCHLSHYPKRSEHLDKVVGVTITCLQPWYPRSIHYFMPIQ